MSSNFYEMEDLTANDITFVTINVKRTKSQCLLHTLQTCTSLGVDTMSGRLVTPIHLAAGPLILSRRVYD